jgi:hypothetical protein
MERQGKADTS